MKPLETIGIATLLHTSNPKFKKYEGKSGELSKLGDSNEYLYFFDMVRYFLRTSIVQKVEYKDCTTQKCKIHILTLNSIYQFEITFSKKYLSMEEVHQSIADTKES